MNKGLEAISFMRKHGRDNCKKCSDGTYAAYEDGTVYFSDDTEITEKDIFGKYFSYNGYGWQCDACESHVSEHSMTEVIIINLIECFRAAYSYDLILDDFANNVFSSHYPSERCCVCGELLDEDDDEDDADE